MIRTLLYALTGLVVVGVLIAPITAFAQGGDVLNGVCSNSTVQNSDVCAGRTPTNPLIGNGGLFQAVVTTIAAIAGVAAVIVIIVAGIKYVTSGSDPAAVQSAKGTLISALVGLAIIALAYSIISLVLGAL